MDESLAKCSLDVLSDYLQNPKLLVCERIGSNWSAESLTAIEGAWSGCIVFIFHMTTIIIAVVVVTKNCKQKYSTDQGVRYLRADYNTGI